MNGFMQVVEGVANCVGSFCRRSISAVGEKARKVGASLKSWLAPATGVAAASAAGSAWATDPVTLPDAGVDMVGLVNALVTRIGTSYGPIIAASLSLFAVVWLLRRAKKI